MYCRVFACDFDGTGATDGHLAPELAAALATARAQGYVTMLVTGRVHEEVEALCTDLSMFDAVVAENGAIVCLPGRERTVQIGTPPPDQLLGELRAHGVPFHAGAVVVGTWDRHANEVLQLIRRLGVDAQLVFNRAAMMLLPSGVNKATGVRRALDELGRSEHNMIAFGDAENDLPLFAMAGLAVAARGSVPAAAAQADDHSSRPGGAGVADYIHHVIERDGIVPTPPRKQIQLGHCADGAPVSLPASGANVMISGDPRSGKSWLAGLIAEQLLDQGYRLCIIDPEGDYLSLAERPGMLAFGHHLALPDPAVLPHLLGWEQVSLVLNLASMAQATQGAYVDAALAALLEYNGTTGIPHWIILDESHYFFQRQGLPPYRRGDVSFLVVTYRPSLISSEVFNQVSAHLVTRTTTEEERYFMTSLLGSRGPHGLVATNALAEIQMPLVGLLFEGPNQSTWQLFTPGARQTAHAHHGRKYADALLPVHKAFRFRNSNEDSILARNIFEFYSAVQTVPDASLRHHLANGDFSRWIAEVIGDRQLAHNLGKLERTVQGGARPDREEILAHIADQYVLEPKTSDKQAGETGRSSYGG